MCISHNFPVTSGSNAMAAMGSDAVASRLVDKEELRNYEGILDDRFQDNFRVRHALSVASWETLYGLMRKWDLEYLLIWLVVTGTMELFEVPFSWEFHPNWRTLIFQRGRYTTNQKWDLYGDECEECAYHGNICSAVFSEEKWFRQKMVDLLGKMSNGTEHGEFMVLIYSEQFHLNTLEIRGLPQPVAQVWPHFFCGWSPLFLAYNWLPRYITLYIYIYIHILYIYTYYIYNFNLTLFIYIFIYTTRYWMRYINFYIYIYIYIWYPPQDLPISQKYWYLQ